MDNLFDVINDKMFSVFSHDGKRSNYDLLSKIYDIFTKRERRQSIERDELIDELTDYIKSRNFDEIDDEEGTDIIGKQPRDIASSKIRQFKKCGWLEEDTGVGFTTILSLSSNAITLLDTFESIIKNKDHPLEYTGYFYAVYQMIVNFEIPKTKAFLEQIIKNTHELFNSLQGLNSSIKQFIEQMLNNSSLTPQGVLDTLLYKYQDQVMVTVFNNLKTKDNPNWYTDKIISSAKRLKYENLDKMIDAYIKTSNEQEITRDRYMQISSQIESNLDEIILSFERVDEFISIIDGKNTKFHSTAYSKLEFLMNTKRDIEGIIDRGLKSLKNLTDENEPLDFVNLFSAQQIDDKSSYSYTFNKKKVTYVESKVPEVSEEEIDKELQRILQEDQFSKKKVNERVLQILDGKEEIDSRNIVISDFDSLLMLIMIQIYSEYDDMVYSVEFEDVEYKTFGYTTKAFILKRRTNI